MGSDNKVSSFFLLILIGLAIYFLLNREGFNPLSKLSNDLHERGLNGIIGISPKFNFGWLPSVFRGFGDFHLYNPTESDFDYDQSRTLLFDPVLREGSLYQI
jgi:hypothetical protein